MEKIAPLSLAETSWDNVGVLLEAPFPRENATKVFLTIDLTIPVLQECIRDDQVGVIISYHPPLFKSFKRLTLDDEKQKIALICSAKGISIYSPHTSLDNCVDGINDWLASGLGAGKVVPINPFVNDYPGSGSGRILQLNEPQPINEITERVKAHLGLSHVRLATREDKPIETIAICAGSGASVLQNVKADLFLTGEMSHHEVLAALSNGTSVILCEHSNTGKYFLTIERGFLKAKLQPLLGKMLNTDGLSKVTVECSQIDRDPLQIV